MALPPLPPVDAEELIELVSARGAVFILSNEVGASSLSLL